MVVVRGEEWKWLWLVHMAHLHRMGDPLYEALFESPWCRLPYPPALDFSFGEYSILLSYSRPCLSRARTVNRGEVQSSPEFEEVKIVLLNCWCFGTDDSIYLLTRLYASCREVVKGIWIAHMMNTFYSGA